jgi:hypothetical protein
MSLARHTGSKVPLFQMLQQALGGKMKYFPDRRPATRQSFGTALALAFAMVAPTIAKSDEGGVSFWVPGFFGSLAMVA